MNNDVFRVLGDLIPFIAIITSVGVAGWVVTTWLRIKHGYPLDGAWGQAVYPKKNEDCLLYTSDLPTN